MNLSTRHPSLTLRQQDRLTWLGLLVLALLLRIPFCSQFLYHWDSVNFALSLEDYDVRLHQPHPPGYFLYSGLGMLVNLVVHDANKSLTLISLVSGALGVVALYWLGTIMFNRQVGIVAALLALTNPLHWFYSEIALSYALEFLLVTVLAGLCYRQLVGEQRGWLWLAILMGIAGGVRQNDLVFLFPLWLVSLWTLSWRRRVASAVILGLVTVTWLWPMMAMSGGPTGYLAALGAESGGIASESPLSSLHQLGLNSVRMTIYLGYGLLLGAIPLLWGGWSLLRTARTHLLDRRVWVFVLWISPAFCFYVFIHIRQHGHIFTFLPALILLASLATTKLGQRWGGSNRAHPLTRALAASLIVTNGLFFLLAPASLFGSERLPLQTPSQKTITQRDRFLSERIDCIRTHFEPQSTAILAGGLDFRHPDFYLREFQNTSLSYQLGEDGTVLPDHVHVLVLFNDAVLPQFSADSGFESLLLPDGQSIRFVTWDSDQRVTLSQSSFEIQE
jgi:hypothetical protein